MQPDLASTAAPATPQSEGVGVEPPPILHPISLEFVSPKELTVTLKAPASKGYQLPDGFCILGSSITAVNKERRFQVSSWVVIGDSEFSKPELPLYLRVELVGGFAITDPSISDETAVKWASVATKFILLPYLRDHVAGLSGRAGFAPFLLPLIQLPVPLAVA